MDNDLVEAWRRNCALNLHLLDWLPDAALSARYAPNTRTAAKQFSHLHNVRVYHLEARGKRTLGGLETFPRGAEPSRREIRRALVASEDALAVLLGDCAARGAVPSWRGPPSTFLAYFVAHEAHHRGLAMAALRVSGVRVPKEIVYGLWDRWPREREPAAPRRPARRARKG